MSTDGRRQAPLRQDRQPLRVGQSCPMNTDRRRPPLRQDRQPLRVGQSCPMNTDRRRPPLRQDRQPLRVGQSCPMSYVRQGAASARRTAGPPLSVHPPNPLATPLSPAPLSVHPPNPLVSPSSPPPYPGKNAKIAAPTPRSAGPAPAAATCCPDAPGQSLEGRVRRMIPVSVCGAVDRRCLQLLHYPASVRQGQYPCRRSGGIFLSFRDSRKKKEGKAPSGRLRIAVGCMIYESRSR